MVISNRDFDTKNYNGHRFSLLRPSFLAIAVSAMMAGVTPAAAFVGSPSAVAVVSGTAGTAPTAIRFRGRRFGRGGGFHGRGFGRRGFGHRGFGHRGFGRRGFAGRRFGRGGFRRGGYGGGYGYGGGAAIGAGIAGLAAGALIGGAIADSNQATAGGNAVAYCESKFKSYDPSLGSYLGYDGERHACP